MLLLLSALAFAGDCTLDRGVYLLTIEPGNTVQNIFGHTALLIYDPEQAAYSPVYDYGRFEQDPPLKMAYEVLTMTKPYFMGARSLRSTVSFYDSWGRGITAQRLNLSATEQEALVGLLTEDLNSDLTFDYNWYRPNCTTMVQERLDEVLGGALKVEMSGRGGPSPAGEVLRHSGPHLPLWFGLQWGSGGFARKTVSAWEGAFLPDRLRSEVSSVQLPGKPLVVETCVLGRTVPTELPKERSSRDGLMLSLGVVGAGLLGILGRWRKAAVVAVGMYGLAMGLFGCAAVLVGGLATFAPFWGAHNLLLASPLHLLLLVAVAHAHVRPSSWIGSGIVGGVGVLAVFGALLGLIQGHENLGLFALMGLPTLAAAFALRPTQQG